MKLQEFQKRIRTEARFKAARKELHNDIAFQIGHMLEGLRLSFGLSQSQFAKKTGFQQPAIARMERGKSIPTLPILRKIADSLEMTLLLPVFVSRNLIVRSKSASKTTSIKSHLSPYFENATRTKDFTRSINP